MDLLAHAVAQRGVDQLVPAHPRQALEAGRDDGGEEMAAVTLDLEPIPPDHDHAWAVDCTVAGTLRFERGVGHLWVGVGRVVAVNESVTQHCIDPGAHVGACASVDGELLGGGRGG